MSTANLVAWLPFDTSTTQDLCGNTWTSYGSPTIQGTELQLDGASYLQLNGGITLGGQDFTICGFARLDTSNPLWYPGIFSLNNKILRLIGVGSYTNRLLFSVNNSEKTVTGLSLTERFHFEIDYVAGTFYLFINGNRVCTWARTFGRTTLSTVLVGSNGDSPTYNGMNWSGTIDEFQIYDGVALHSTNFTPPTNNDYIADRLALAGEVPFNFEVDVAREVRNVIPVELSIDVERTLFKTWRYVNLGDADDLIVDSTILTDLLESQSKTGTAFYQTAREKCFDLSATDEVWLKFDVYFNGAARWRAYNEGSNGYCGMIAQTNGNLDYWANSDRVYVLNGGAAINRLQHVRLHMISGSTDGVIEAWVDGEKIYTYTGNVNNGEDFADIYLQSDGAGTFFSNVIISNVEIKPGEGYHLLALDTERRIKKIVEVNADVERNIMQPIIVPLIGEHFNHYVANLTVYRDFPIKIVLPHLSDVYVRCNSNDALRIFSDTDAIGKVSSEVYAELEDCEVAFAQINDKATPQCVIRAFMNSLDETALSSTAALNAAINFASNGKFADRDTLVDAFMADLDGSASYSVFLQDYCDIQLYNADTGAITGWDAGGGVIKTSSSVVPEEKAVSEWTMPLYGSATTIDGLRVIFPVVGADGENFTDAENHILAGLNSEWIHQSLLLIKESFGLEFNSASSINEIEVNFEEDSSNNNLAWVNWQFNSGKATSLSLTINMYYYEDIDLDEDGTRSSTNKLDRIIAHEFTHAVMAANINYFYNLPKFITEGAAELVHGIDDFRRSTISALVSTRQSDLQDILLGNSTGSGGDAYAAGYLFFRYLAKQGQGYTAQDAPESIEITNLLISDGATDSHFVALTDNTRQTLSNDVLRTLIKTLSPAFDVEIFDVVPVEVPLDVARNLLAKIKLFETDTSQYFSGEDSEPVLIPSQAISLVADDSNNLRSLEISLTENQLSDQVHFVAVTPFDILQPFGGQYLDYQNQMRVESTRQDGILCSCACCSDIDEILYTQFNYQLDSGFVYFMPDYETMTLRRLTEAPDLEHVTDTLADSTLRKGRASSHLQKIASLLGANEVICNFDDFVSNIAERQKDVTYQDLISQLFGWSSRLPQRMINCYLRNGILYAIQRGKEAHILDLSQADCTYPVVEKKLMRTMWGSGKSGISPTTEKDTISTKRLIPGHKVYPPPPSVSADGKTQYIYHDVSSYSGIEHGYALSSTETQNDDGGRTIVDYHYNTVNGVYTCTSEEYRVYDADGKKVDERRTIHERLTPSQQFSRMDDEDGNTVASNVGSNLPGFYDEWYWLYLPREVGPPDYDIDKITGYNPLIDTDFPVLDANIYSQLIAAYAWLNRRTQETLTFDVYDYPHLIDFNDRILFGGYEYHLVSNTATSNENIRNKQSLRIVRWF